MYVCTFTYTHVQKYSWIYTKCLCDSSHTFSHSQGYHVIKVQCCGIFGIRGIPFIWMFLSLSSCWDCQWVIAIGYQAVINCLEWISIGIYVNDEFVLLCWSLYSSSFTCWKFIGMKWDVIKGEALPQPPLALCNPPPQCLHCYLCLLWKGSTLHPGHTHHFFAFTLDWGKPWYSVGKVHTKICSWGLGIFYPQR